MTCRKISPVRSPAEPIRTNQGFAHSGDTLIGWKGKKIHRIFCHVSHMENSEASHLFWLHKFPCFPTPPLSRAERLQNLWGGFFHHGKFFGFRKSACRQSGHREFAAQIFSCDVRYLGYDDMTLELVDSLLRGVRPSPWVPRSASHTTHKIPTRQYTFH